VFQETKPRARNALESSRQSQVVSSHDRTMNSFKGFKGFERSVEATKVFFSGFMDASRGRSFSRRRRSRAGDFRCYYSLGSAFPRYLGVFIFSIIPRKEGVWGLFDIEQNLRYVASVVQISTCTLPRQDIWLYRCLHVGIA